MTDTSILIVLIALGILGGILGYIYRKKLMPAIVSFLYFTSGIVILSIICEILIPTRGHAPGMSFVVFVVGGFFSILVHLIRWVWDGISYKKRWMK